MTSISGFVERRRWDRYRTMDTIRIDCSKRRIFSLINSSVKKSARLVDISRGGVTFIYEDSKMWSADFDKLSIVVDGNRIVAEDLPYSVVSDYRISLHDNATVARRCGVRFGELTSAQKSQLDKLIRNHTINFKTMERRTGAEGRKPDDSQYNGPERRKSVGLAEQSQRG